jgi:hypothetical protein
VDTPQLPAALVGGRLDVVVGAALPAGTNNIGDVDVLSVPAPLSTTGGGTEAAALRVTVANDSTGVLSVDDNGGSLTVDGTVTANQGTAAATVGAWPIKVTDGTNTAAVKAASTAAVAADPALVVALSPNDRSLVAAAATLTNVASSASSVSLLAANTARRGLIVYNDSNQSLYLKFGVTASTTSFTYLMTPKSTLEMILPIYQGAIDGIWAAANGSARITELT